MSLKPTIEVTSRRILVTTDFFPEWAKAGSATLNQPEQKHQAQFTSIHALPSGLDEDWATSAE